ncbi:hypothetical protein ANCCAN_13072 [Ancylostoma caninum]|uniref:Uncharacterized protein n=1 Tax=Ancylostoma caninum TaxID=29170 RepID=A0A368GDV2_ANCCA|nr:hypothetical protein ANCCAN_13072 [Ancylostoma caninum]
MRGSRRGTFPSRPGYPERGVEFFPRGRDDNRRPRNAPAPYPHDNRSDPGYARSGRDMGFTRRKDVPNGRSQEGFSQNTDSYRRGSQYITNERGGPSYGSRGYGPSESSNNNYSMSGESRMPPNENDNRYKYLNEGWYSEYKTVSSSAPAPPQPNPYRSRDQRDPRNGYGTQAHARENVERFRAEKGSHSVPDPSSNMSKYGYVNPSIARETRELEQRMAAIQRELDMLETDKKRLELYVRRHSSPPTIFLKGQSQSGFSWVRKRKKGAQRTTFICSPTTSICPIISQKFPTTAGCCSASKNRTRTRNPEKT